MNKKKPSNKVPKTFLVSLLFAMLFWSLIKLSREYKTVVSFPVEYVNIPQNKLIQNTPLEAIDIQVKGSGFKLVSLNFSSKTIRLDANRLQRKNQNEYYFLVKNQKLAIQNQITNNYTVNFIVQDTIYLDLGMLASKKVPVIGNVDLEYKLGYHLVEEFKFKPDSILISGPESQLNKITSINLEKLNLKNVSTNIKEEVAILETLAFQKIKFSTKKVQVSGSIDKFTEGTIQLPFEIINQPDSISITTFPKSLSLIYQVGLSNFNNVNTSSFKIVCDYQNSIDNNLNYLIPKVISKPNFITSIKLNPAKIEFLIQK
jgi:hypothetical protein